MANTAASTHISPSSGRDKGFRTTSRCRIAGACLTPAHMVASDSTPGTGLSATGLSATCIRDLDTIPTAPERLVQRHRVGQDLLIAGQQRELRGQQRALVFEHIELRYHADLQL